MTTAASLSNESVDPLAKHYLFQLELAENGGLHTETIAPRENPQMASLFFTHVTSKENHGFQFAA